MHVVVLPAVQAPDWQTSLESHALPSLHDVPSVAAGLEHAPVRGLQAPATWHASEAMQAVVPPAVHAPETHESFRSQALPSLQAVPSRVAGLEHWPVDMLHVPATWHWSDAVHVTGFEPAHTPLAHTSVCVQALASVHVVPSVAAGLEHWPVDALQVPATWHWSEAAHAMGFDPVHAPFSHASVCVQALPSLHVVPSAAGGFEHCPVEVLHVPATWHWSDTPHVIGFAPVHAPLWHESVCVQALPSLQVVPLAAVGFEQSPVVALHAPATWHWSDTPHVIGFEPVHVPLWHESVCVQALPSLHVVPFATGVCVQAPAVHASAVHALPSSHDPEQPLPPIEPKLSWHVTVAPEFITTSAAASAPTNCDVFTVTWALVATKSAWI
jgi:hypothetical protein